MITFGFFFRHNIFFLLPAIPQPLPARSRPTDFIPAAARLMSLRVFNDPPPQIMYNMYIYMCVCVG